MPGPTLTVLDTKSDSQLAKSDTGSRDPGTDSAILLRASYAMSGTAIAYAALRLRMCYTMSGPDLAVAHVYGATRILLRACYAMSGTGPRVALHPSCPIHRVASRELQPDGAHCVQAESRSLFAAVYGSSAVVDGGDTPVYGSKASIYGGVTPIYASNASIYGGVTPIYASSATVYRGTAAVYGCVERSSAAVCGCRAASYGGVTAIHAQNAAICGGSAALYGRIADI
eukprot:1206112-Rhodomonas_salina.3